MIIDSSVIVSILSGEAEAQSFADAIAEAPRREISAVNYVEAAVVVDSRDDPVLSRKIDDLLRDAQVGIEPVSAEQARLARAAYPDFRKGGQRTGLNFGDCFAYALAKDKGEPHCSKETNSAGPTSSAPSTEGRESYSTVTDFARFLG
jgi:ribonuclease VapC